MIIRSMKESIPHKSGNKYSKKYSVGDKVRFIHAGRELSREVAEITGYDKDGFYTFTWDDGEKSNGVGDVNFKLVKKGKSLLESSNYLYKVDIMMTLVAHSVVYERGSSEVDLLDDEYESDYDDEITKSYRYLVGSINNSKFRGTKTKIEAVKCKKGILHLRVSSLIDLSELESKNPSKLSLDIYDHIVGMIKPIKNIDTYMRNTSIDPDSLDEEEVSVSIEYNDYYDTKLLSKSQV